jgi:hypothetical protein
MIVSNRDHALGTRITVISTRFYNVQVSTAKEGMFEKQSTMIAEVQDTVTREGLRAVGKVIYTPSLSSADRLEMHNVICANLDSGGASMMLGDSLNIVGFLLQARGVISEFVNIAQTIG